MRTLPVYLILTVFAAGLLRAEEAPVKKRPRIRVYDQPANLVPVVPKVQDTRAAEADLEKRIRNDMKAPGTLENPVSSISFLPELASSSMFSQPENTEETEEESWITPQNFLLEEDMLSQDDRLTAETDNPDADNGEMEITDWEALQKEMIAEVFVAKEVEMTDEEMEALLANEKATEDTLRDSGIMSLEQMAPVEAMQAVGQSDGEAPSLDMAGFVPVLPARDQMAGEIVRPQRDRDPRLELSGSRNLLNNLKEKWGSSGNPPGAASRMPAASPALPGESLMSRGPLVNGGLSGGLGGLSRENPAVMPMSAVQSRLPEVAPVMREPASPQPRNEFRIRSTLGLPPGM